MTGAVSALRRNTRRAEHPLLSGDGRRCDVRLTRDGRALAVHQRYHLRGKALQPLNTFAAGLAAEIEDQLVHADRREGAEPIRSDSVIVFAARAQVAAKSGSAPWTSHSPKPPTPKAEAVDHRRQHHATRSIRPGRARARRRQLSRHRPDAYPSLRRGPGNKEVSCLAHCFSCPTRCPHAIEGRSVPERCGIGER